MFRNRFVAASLPLVLLGLLCPAAPAFGLTAKEFLGKLIFFDRTLSVGGNQSCASCHDPAVGWTGPDTAINAHGAVYEGSVAGRFGNRKPPSAAYASFSPILHATSPDGGFVGGNFWDGRATGERLGNPAAEQALGPFLNPLEQALPSHLTVVSRICNGTYADVMLTVWGLGICLPGRESEAYDGIGLSVAAYEASGEVSAFTSKYDAWLQGKARLTRQEKRGLKLFNGKGMCFRCHPSAPGPGGEPPLFTDFSYDNLGLPRNPDNPFYGQTLFNPLGEDWVDGGLGGFLASRIDYAAFAVSEHGKHKVPTLRNVAKRPSAVFVKAYGHNGYFKDLREIVHFYNTRDVDAAWPPPEVPANVNADEMGNLGLTPRQEKMIVRFLRTLSDGWLTR
jgi:cytochrome c peroxidase